MSIIEKIEKLKKLRNGLKYRDDIDKKEYRELKQFYDINIDYWEEELESLVNEI